MCVAAGGVMLTPWEWLVLACGAVIVIFQWWEDRRARRVKVDGVCLDVLHGRHTP